MIFICEYIVLRYFSNLLFQRAPFLFVLSVLSVWSLLSVLIVFTFDTVVVKCNILNTRTLSVLQVCKLVLMPIKTTTT